MIKTRIEDWYDNLIYNIRHIRGNIRSFFNFLSRWISYYKVLREAHDFDYTSILVVERHQIIRVRNAIIKYQDHADWERDVYWMNIALKLLDIIEEDGCSKLIGKGFCTKLREDGLYELIDDKNSKWMLPIYVNISNYKRFIPVEKEQFEDLRIGSLIKDRLRVEKAWCLYHKLKMYKMRSWWD